MSDVSAGVGRVLARANGRVATRARGQEVGGLTCGCISAVGTRRAVRTRVAVVAQAVLGAGALAAWLVGLGERVRGRVGALVVLMRRLEGLRLMLVLRRVSLRVVLLVDDAGRARVVKVLLRRRRTLLLMVGMMLHRDKMHQ